MVSAFNMKLLSNEFCLKKCGSDFYRDFDFLSSILTPSIPLQLFLKRNYRAKTQFRILSLLSRTVPQTSKQQNIAHKS